MGEKEISMFSNQNFFKEISKNNSRSNLEIYVSSRISRVSLFHTKNLSRDIKRRNRSKVLQTETS